MSSELEIAAKYARFPKVELHVHLDGACRLTTLQDLSRKYQLNYPHDDLKEFRKCVALPSAVSSLVDFLKVFTALGDILRTTEALERVAYEYCEDAHRQNVVYVEMRYNPLRKLPGPTGQEFCEAVIAGLKRGERDFGIKTRSILCFMRGKPECCEELVSLAAQFKDRGVVGVDIAGDELQPLTQEHIDGFTRARELGLHVTAHAGESGPAGNVTEAISVLRAERIGHGYHVVDSETDYQFAKESKVHFEVCPTSSVFTNSTTHDNHPTRRFAQDNVSYSLSTDDPGVMLCDLNTEYVVAEQNIGLSHDQLKLSVINGARAAFLPDAEKQELVELIERKFEALSTAHVH